MKEEYVELGEVAYEPIEQSGPNDSHEFVYIDIGSIDRETKKITAAKNLPSSEAPSRAKQRLKVGDVLISMTRPNLNAVAIVPISLDGAIGSTGFHVLRSKWVEPKFLFYLVQTQRFIDEMCRLVQGALYPAVRPKDISSFKFLLPSSFAQTRIVEKLEELFSDLDAGVAELKAAQKKLAQYRQSLLKAAVEGTLTAEWRAERAKSSEPLETGAQLLERILIERRRRWEEKQLAKFKEQGKTPPKDWRNKYPEPVKPKTADFPELPEGWVWGSVDQIGEVFLGKMLDKEKHQSGRKIPYIRNINVRWGYIETNDILKMYFEEDELERYGLLAGDVLVCEGGEPGRAAICSQEHENFQYQKALHRVRFFGYYIPNILVFYLENLAKTGKLDSYFTGSTIKHFTRENFVSLPIPVPSIKEQYRLISIVNTVLEKANYQNQAIAFSLKQSAAQRQNILKAAFSGQLVPQDPNDEPASVLLERIRAERAARANESKQRSGHRKAKGVRVK
jgi:type I restriction enzyme S subunit